VPPLDEHDVALIRADNPGPFTLSGTNTYVVGRDPCWVVDPGPALEGHLAAIEAEVGARGGARGIVLTHDHADHAESAQDVATRLGVRVAATRAPRATVRISDGDEAGPFRVIATPGHAPDHVALVAGRVCFTGDAVLGEGSVFIAPDPGALSGYLASLERLQAMDLALLCPGHGPVVEDPHGKIGEYLAHRRDRERRVIAALDDGKRSVEELLDEVWDDAPAVLRPAAAVTLAAHLDKLEEEGRMPEGVERPKWPW